MSQRLSESWKKLDVLDYLMLELLENIFHTIHEKLMDELGYKMMWAAANDRRNITISYLIFKRTCQTILQAHQNEQVMATTIRLTSNV